MAGSGPAPPAPADPDAYQELSGRQDSRDGERRRHRGGGRADGDPRASRRVRARRILGFRSSWTPRRFPGAAGDVSHIGGAVHVETCEKS